MNKIFNKNKSEPTISVREPTEARHVTDRVDFTKFYVGYDFKASDQIIIRQPTVGDIVEYGEENYFKMIYALTTIPSDMISELWDNGIDFQKIPDLEFFYGYVTKFGKDETKILFGDSIDFTHFKLGLLGGKPVLYDPDSGIIITEEVYSRMTSFLCCIHQIKKEKVTAAGPMAFRGLVEVDRQEKAMLKTRSKSKLVLFPLLSSMENSPGFKYTVDEAMKLPFFRFMDSVKRISLITTVNQLAIGHFTGSFDKNKFRADKELNWMRDLYE